MCRTGVRSRSFILRLLSTVDLGTHPPSRPEAGGLIYGHMCFASHQRSCLLVVTNNCHQKFKMEWFDVFYLGI